MSDYTQVKWINVDSMINECGADRHKCCVGVARRNWSISYTFRQFKGVGKGKVLELCCPSGVTNLIFDFAHLSTRFTVKFNRRETCFTLPLALCLPVLPPASAAPSQCCPALQFYCHIFAHDLTKCAENAAFIFAQQSKQTVEHQQKRYNKKKPVQRDDIWCSMQTTSGLNAHKNTSYSMYIYLTHAMLHVLHKYLP